MGMNAKERKKFDRIALFPTIALEDHPRSAGIRTGSLMYGVSNPGRRQESYIDTLDAFESQIWRRYQSVSTSVNFKESHGVSVVSHLISIGLCPHALNVRGHPP